MLELLEAAAEALGDLSDEVVFIGAATIPLWITDLAASTGIETVDVDVVVEVSTRGEYEQFGQRLREHGFSEDSNSPVIVRWKHAGKQVSLDAIPTSGKVFGFSNRWISESFAHFVRVDLPSNVSIQAASPTFLIATKLEAFGSRRAGDFYGSKDFHDIVTLVDGRIEIVDDVRTASDELGEFVADAIREMANDSNFAIGVEAQLGFGPDVVERARVVTIPRFRELASVGSN